MTSVKLVKKIRNYAVASFLIPLITINLCLLIYKFIGEMNINIYPDFNWDKNEHTYTWNEYNTVTRNHESYSFTNCPKYKYSLFWNFIDNKTILWTVESSELIEILTLSNKAKSLTIKNNKTLLNSCVKNHQFLYSLLKKFSWIETILIHAKQKNTAGYAKVKNPYFYGEVSISRTARYFPAIFVFKSLIILSSLLLFLYWKNNLNLFNELNNKNDLSKFSKKFFYLGVFSCIFLALHAAFLGLDFDSKLFVKIRKLIIISFIFFELSAQLFLTKILFELRKELKKYIYPLILKIKIIFVIMLLFTTCVAFIILVFGNPSTAFKHILEWNYFAFLLFYYLLSRLLWRYSETPVHTPEGA